MSNRHDDKESHTGSGAAADRSQSFDGGQDWNPFERSQTEWVIVSGDDPVSARGEGAGKEGIVIGIVGNGANGCRRRDQEDILLDGQVHQEDNRRMTESREALKHSTVLVGNRI